MSLTSFTNEPGERFQYKIIDSHQWGKWFGWEGSELIGQNYYKSAHHAKPWPTASDHIRATTWSRSVGRVNANEPAIWRRYQTEGNPPDDYVVIDLYWEDPITNRHTPFTYETPNPGWDNARDESITEALNSLADYKAETAANLAQARQTCDMFSRTAARFAGAFGAMRRGNFKLALTNHLGITGAKKSRRFGSDLWLEYSYGWKPLMNDLYELNQLVHQILYRPIEIEGRGFGKSSYTDDWLYADRLYVRGSNDASHSTVLRGSLSSKALYLLQNAGLVNPLSVAWELVPWSFAIDWFMPVGQTLEAMTAGFGLQDNGGWTSSRTKTILNLSEKLTTAPWFPLGSFRVGGGNYSEERFHFRRTAYAEFPRPRFFADTTPYSTSRALNAIALVNKLR